MAGEGRPDDVRARPVLDRERQGVVGAREPGGDPAERQRRPRQRQSSRPGFARPFQREEGEARRSDPKARPEGGARRGGPADEALRGGETSQRGGGDRRDENGKKGRDSRRSAPADKGGGDRRKR